MTRLATIINFIRNVDKAASNSTTCAFASIFVVVWIAWSEMREDEWGDCKNRYLEKHVEPRQCLQLGENSVAFFNLIETICYDDENWKRSQINCGQKLLQWNKLSDRRIKIKIIDHKRFPTIDGIPPIKILLNKPKTKFEHKNSKWRILLDDLFQENSISSSPRPSWLSQAHHKLIYMSLW